MPFEKWRSTITVGEISHRLGICPETVYAMLKSKEIPSLRPFRRFIISRQAYLQWEASIGRGNVSDLHPQPSRLCKGPAPEPTLKPH
jgi:excisionase family DNA binding protein